MNKLMLFNAFVAGLFRICVSRIDIQKWSILNTYLSYESTASIKTLEQLLHLMKPFLIIVGVLSERVVRGAFIATDLIFPKLTSHFATHREL